MSNPLRDLTNIKKNPKQRKTIEYQEEIEYGYVVEDEDLVVLDVIDFSSDNEMLIKEV